MMAEKRPYREEIAEDIIRRIEAGTAPWQKPWAAGTIGAAPFNPVSGKPYRGINDVWLSVMGRSDPRWMTYNQALEAGAQVRKGEKSATIEYWQWTAREAVLDGDGKPVLSPDGKQQSREVRLDRPRVFYAKVFNAEQIDGLAPWVAPLPAFDPSERAEALIAGAGVPVFHDQGDRAFYSPARDEIHLPARGAFKGQAAYYETVLHELGHATGHDKRFGRAFGPFGSEGYAREELRAEIASYMLARDLGISFDPANHAAYVGSWLKALRQDNNEIFRAARDAELIKTWVMEPEKRPSLEQAARQQKTAQVSIGAEAGPQTERQGLGRTAARGQEQRPAVMDVSMLDRLENYFRPGRIVPSLYGQDKVVEFHREKNGYWQVAVQSVEADGTRLGPIPTRTHCSLPREENLAAWEKDHPVAARPRVYLAVPFAEKNAVKAAGARWDADAKSWYIPVDADPAAFAKWNVQPQESGKTQLKEAVAPDSRRAEPERPQVRTYLAVPFAEKDAAKDTGAKWDPKEKSWYIPEGLDPALFAKWAGKESKAPSSLDPVKEFTEALKKHGLRLEEAPVMDGKWHRVAVKGDGAYQLSGSYRGSLDGRPSGQIMNHRTNNGPVRWEAVGQQIEAKQLGTEKDTKKATSVLREKPLLGM